MRPPGIEPGSIVPQTTVLSVKLWAPRTGVIIPQKITYNKPMTWFIYILQCADKSLYTGITNDLEKRLVAHNDGKGAKYTKVRLPVKIVYQKKVKTRSEALIEEAVMKKLTRQEKLNLIKL